MVTVDTNIILRYLLKDNESLFNKACDIMDNNDIYIPNEVIIEVAYVLKKVYSIDKDVIYALIVELLAQDYIKFSNRAIIHEAFKLYAKKNYDLVDCMLYAYKVVEHKEIKTFDKKLEKILEST